MAGRPTHSPNCLFFTADDNQNTIQWDYSHSSNISNATHFLPALHLLPLMTPPQFTVCSVGWPRILSKIRKLPHWGRVFFSPVVTRCPPVWRWWRWWENISYSTRPVCLLYLYISMWSPLWEHHICSAQQFHSSPRLCVCLLYSSPVTRANVIEFNIMDVHIFSHIFRCIVKSMLRIPKLVIVRPGWWMLHWMWRITHTRVVCYEVRQWDSETVWHSVWELM